LPGTGGTGIIPRLCGLPRTATPGDTGEYTPAATARAGVLQVQQDWSSVTEAAGRPNPGTVAFNGEPSLDVSLILSPSKEAGSSSE